MIISLDIETYGAFKSFEPKGVACPNQTVFHPALSKRFDMGTCLPCRLVPQCAVTLVDGNENDPTSWTPGKTAVFDMCSDLAMVEEILAKAKVILGSNIVFDLLYLQEFPSIRKIFTNDIKPILVDTIILSWMHSGIRKSRSLKALGPALGAFTYDRTLKDGKFEFPMSADAIKYNAEDTHNAVLAARALAERIRDEHSKTPTSIALDFHSDRLWCIESMSRTGQTFNTKDIIDIATRADKRAGTWEYALTHNGIIPSGEGSGTTQSNLIFESVLQAEKSFPGLHDSGLLEYTDKKRSVRNNKENRNILSAMILENKLLTALNEHAQNVATYQECRRILSPTIDRGEGHTVVSGCIEVGDQTRCYPSWYGAPTDEGGIQSARLSCRRPAAQTWCKEIRNSMRPNTGTIYHMDMTAFELRVAAAISRDHKMQQFAFQLDPYSNLVGSRDAMKTALLVGVNGGGMKKAARTAMAVTGKWVNQHDIDQLPIFTEWKDYAHTREIWWAHGQSGHLRLDEADILYNHNANKTIHDTTSFKVQGTAAVFMSMIQSKMLFCGKQEYEFHLQLHDELVFSTPYANQRTAIWDDVNRCIQMACEDLFGVSYGFTFKLYSAE